MKVLNFKTISPFFEQERDGIKPFTIRQWDGADERFQKLAKRYKYDVVKITNPNIGQSFTRVYKGFATLDISPKIMEYRKMKWIIIYLGESVAKPEG